MKFNITSKLWTQYNVQNIHFTRCNAYSATRTFSKKLSKSVHFCKTIKFLWPNAESSTYAYFEPNHIFGRSNLREKYRKLCFSIKLSHSHDWSSAIRVGIHLWGYKYLEGKILWDLSLYWFISCICLQIDKSIYFRSIKTGF